MSFNCLAIETQQETGNDSFLLFLLPSPSSITKNDLLSIYPTRVFFFAEWRLEEISSTMVETERGKRFSSSVLPSPLKIRPKNGRND